MTYQPEIDTARAIAAGLIAMVDQIATLALDQAANEPTRADGTIADPYARGMYDGTLSITTALSGGFSEALVALDGHRS